MDTKPEFTVRTKDHAGRISDYWPLAVLTGIAAMGAGAIIYPMPSDGAVWMQYFMGLFLCIFAMLKIFNLKAFFKGFRMYDLLAKRIRIYAYIYPFIELALGLGYLAFIAPEFVYGATIIVMGISAVSVILALRKGLNINCPCMGTILNVPLSTVTLTEDVAMGAMAVMLLLHL